MSLPSRDTSNPFFMAPKAIKYGMNHRCGTTLLRYTHLLRDLLTAEPINALGRADLVVVLFSIPYSPDETRNSGKKELPQLVPPARFTRTALLILVADRLQPFPIGNHNCLPTEADEALFCPSRQYAADGKQGGAGHLRHFLTR